MLAIGGKVSSEHERATAAAHQRAAAARPLRGEQYLAVMVGYGGAAAMFTAWALPNQPRLPGRLLVFKLGGAATVAPLSQADAGYARSLDRQAGRSGLGRRWLPSRVSGGALAPSAAIGC